MYKISHHIRFYPYSIVRTRLMLALALDAPASCKPVTISLASLLLPRSLSLRTTLYSAVLPLFLSCKC